MVLKFVNMSFGQIELRVDYLGKSHFGHQVGESLREKVGDSEERMTVYEVFAKVPVSIKRDSNKQIIWGEA